MDENYAVVNFESTYSTNISESIIFVENIYPTKANILADILEPIVKLNGTKDEAKKAADGVYEWLKSVGVAQKLSDMGFSENDVEKLTNLAFTTPSLGGLLAIAPTEANKEAVIDIYKKSM